MCTLHTAKLQAWGIYICISIIIWIMQTPKRINRVVILMQGTVIYTHHSTHHWNLSLPIVYNKLALYIKLDRKSVLHMIWNMVHVHLTCTSRGGGTGPADPVDAGPMLRAYILAEE